MPPNQVADQFGENLRLLRGAIGISQEELGMRCSLHRTEIGLLERGARVPRIDTVIKIATGLGVEAELLLEGIDWTPGETQPPGRFTTKKARIEKFRELMERARKLREKQTKTVDAVELIHEARDEMARRGQPPEGDEQ